MNEYLAVIFDLDGTLLDTITDLKESMNHVMVDMGLETFTIDEVKHMVGLGVDIFIDRVIAKRKIGTDRFAWIKERYLGYYIRAMNDNTAPYPGIEAMLDIFVEADVKLAVLSNKPEDQVMSVIQSYFPDIRFSLVFGKRDEYPLKPDPTSLYVIIEELGVPKDRILYVGDTATDMETAVNAGVDSVGVVWGFRDREELVASGAKFVVERPGQIVNLVFGGDFDDHHAGWDSRH